MKSTSFWHYTYISLLCVLLFTLAACSNGSSGADTTPTAGRSTPTTSTSSGGSVTTPISDAKPGVQPCPAVVSATTYWDPIVATQSGVSAVGRVLCANLIGNSSLQAMIQVDYEGTGHIVDVYVFNNITNPSPQQIFKLQGLYKGNASISAYNTILTAEVDQNSSLNKNVEGNAGLQEDLFREFKWSDGAGTLVPVSFPGIFPDLTRYQAESDQQSVNQGHQPWKLNAGAVSTALAASLLNWSPNAPATIVSGGRQHDLNAVVNVKSTNLGSGTIKVTLSRLEGNTNGIWEATAVESAGMSITAPQNRDRLTSPSAVTGTGNAFEGKIGVVKVLDHLYDPIGQANAVGASGNGSTTFSTNVSYDPSFKGGSQEGVVALYSYSNADGSIAGAVMLKELLSA